MRFSLKAWRTSRFERSDPFNSHKYSGCIADNITQDRQQTLEAVNMCLDYIPAIIRILGIGNAGGKALQHMIDSGLGGSEQEDISFIYADTDAQALACSGVENKILLGEEQLHGCGTESRPELGAKAAEESLDAIREAIGNADMLFLVAGMGGGTGTGALPVIAGVANELGILTVCVITKPFHSEGAKPMQIALRAISELLPQENCLLTISNDHLLLDSPTSGHADLLKKADEAIYTAVRGICDTITKDSMIAVDFADIRCTLNPGWAFMGKGVASGQNRALHAAREALSSLSSENIAISNALGILVNITASEDFGFDECSDVMLVIHDAAKDPNGEEPIISILLLEDENCGDEVHITVIACGFNAHVPNIAGQGSCLRE